MIDVMSHQGFELPSGARLFPLKHLQLDEHFAIAVFINRWRARYRTERKLADYERPDLGGEG